MSHILIKNMDYIIEADLENGKTGSRKLSFIPGATNATTYHTVSGQSRQDTSIQAHLSNHEVDLIPAGTESSRICNYS